MFSYLSFSASQAPGGGQPNGNNGTNVTAACNPTIQQCDNAQCNTATTPGRILVNRPGRNAYAYIGSSINITWSYTEGTDNRTFPVNGFSFYYKKKEDDNSKWISIGNATKGNNTVYTWNPQVALMKDTRYQLLILVDNVASSGTGDQGPGIKASCLAEGFPVGKCFCFLKLGYPEDFVAINLPSGPSDPNNPDPCTGKYCPAENSSVAAFSLNQFLLYLELLGGLFLVYAF